MSKIVSKPDHGDAIVVVENNRIIPTPEFQLYLDEIEEKLNTYLLADSVIHPTYTIATLPDASKNTGGHINISDETGGFTGAESDGTNWRRYSDRAIAS